jgi:hypothetical protein
LQRITSYSLPLPPTEMPKAIDVDFLNPDGYTEAEQEVNEAVLGALKDLFPKPEYVFHGVDKNIGSFTARFSGFTNFSSREIEKLVFYATGLKPRTLIYKPEDTALHIVMPTPRSYSLFQRHSPQTLLLVLLCALALCVILSVVLPRLAPYLPLLKLE